MHKTERKYEVGKVTDEEQAKQRQFKGFLNKLTRQNFEKLFEQVKQVNIDNAGTLSVVIAQIFDMAILEPTFCEMYAKLCSRLSVELPDFSEDNEKITFKRLLLNKCQEEFERGEREQEEANRTEEEGDVKQSEEEREEKRVKARRRMLGNIRLIGELYKQKMLTERIMHECIKKLLGNYQNPDEEDIEALCTLMSTIGEMIDHPKAKEHMDAYFDMMFKLSNNMKLSSRVRFMLKDSIDLRKNKWQQRRKVEGPNPNPSFNPSGSSTVSISSGSTRPAIPPRTYPPSPYGSAAGPGRIPPPSPPSEDPGEVYKRTAINKLVENVHNDVHELRKKREIEMEGMFNTQAVLRQREDELSKGLREMHHEKEGLEQQLQMVFMNTDVLEQWVRENEGKLGGNAAIVNGDEAFEPLDSLSKQMMESTASDLAIEDVIYALDKAVQDGSIPFDLYLRNVRLLSREQFFHRATSAKVRAAQMQAQVISMAARAPPYGV